MAKGASHETEAQRLSSEEAARQLDAQLASARQHAQQLESQLRAKDQALERTSRQLEAQRATEQQLQVRGGAALRWTLSHTNTWCFERSCPRVLSLSDTAPQAQRRELEEACQELQGEAAALRSRCAQLEGAVKAKEREMGQLGKQADAQRAAEHEAAAAKLQADELVRCALLA